MEEKIEKLRKEVIELCKKPDFIHNKWFVKYHLEIFEKIALEAANFYPEADKDMIITLVWMHDYGKIIDFDNQYSKTLTHWWPFLEKLWFPKNFIEKVIDNIRIMDEKKDIENSNIEVKIASSADWASHLVWPFYNLWWYENYEKDFEELMDDNRKKALKDWNKKVFLPEIKTAFEARFNFLLEQSWDFPDKFL